MLLKVCATKDAVLEMCALKNAVLEMNATKHVVLKVCSLFCGLKNVVLEMSATKDAVLEMCALFSAVLILYVRSLFCGLPTKKNVVLTQRYPKTCGLKKVPISQPQQPLQSPSFAQHIFIDLATCHYSLRSPSPLAVAPHPGKVTPNFASFQKFSLFRVVHWQIHFFSAGPKNTRFFNAPELDVY